MPSIVNGLFAGRSGIASHGTAIAVIGDNIANSSTIGYKASRAEFEDLIAGSQTTGRTIGSGSSTAGISTIFEQGTLEFTSRPLDLAIDGNGFFVVADGSQRFYTRAGNFKLDPAGYIVDQDNSALLGFPSTGSGALEPLNVNSVSQSSVDTGNVDISGNLDAGSAVLTNGVNDIPDVDPVGGADNFDTTYAQLNSAADFSTVVETFDTLGESHTVTFMFFHTGSNEWTVRGYVNSEDVDAAGDIEVGHPRLIANNVVNSTQTLNFGQDGSRTNAPAATSQDISAQVAWNNGSDPTNTVNFTFSPFTQYSSSSNILSITQDGRGIGAVTSVSIESNGDIYALLDNGQSSVIGTVGLINFANPEGLTRIGANRLQQSVYSGEPIVGEPTSGTFGSVQAGSIELSTVDIANEFVKMITLQRGFQASSRIITTINQLLNEIIQLA